MTIRKSASASLRVRRVRKRLGRWVSHLWWLWLPLKWQISLATSVILGPLIVIIITEGQNPKQALTTSVATHQVWWLIVPVSLAVFALLASWAHTLRQRQMRLDNVFLLCKSTEELELSDFGFQAVHPGEVVDQSMHPFWGAYILRSAVHYADGGTPEGTVQVYSEEVMGKSLEDRLGFCFIDDKRGSGMTLTSYALLERLRDRTVIRPPLSQKAHDDLTLRPLKGEDVVLFLENIPDYVNERIDLWELHQQLTKNGARVVVLATGRAAEFRIMMEESRSMTAKFLQEYLPLRLRLCPLSPEEICLLAETTGKPLSLDEAALVSTPGSITMARRSPQPAARRL